MKQSTEAISTTKERSVYVRYCTAAIAALNARYEMTKVIGHSGSAGGVRESILRDFLAAHLPEMTSSVTGMVFDAGGTRSRQQDIVFVLKTFPRLPFANGCDLIFVEGVVATVEIKTRIKASDWRGIADNIASVRALKPTGWPVVTMGDLDWEGQVFSAVITYDGAALDRVKQAVVKLPEEGRPHVYLDLKKGMLVRNVKGLVNNGVTGDYINIVGANDAFAQFLMFLTRITGRLSFVAVDWKAYLC